MAVLASLSMGSCGGTGGSTPAAPAPGGKAAAPGQLAPATKPAPAGDGKSGNPAPAAGSAPTGASAAAPATSTPPAAPAKPAPRTDRTVTTSAPAATPPKPPAPAPAASGADDAKSDLLFQLTMLRAQIEQYNAEHPRKAYDGRAPLDDFWQPLMKATYVLAIPINPLQKSATVARSPAPGVGWVWATRQGVMNLYAVDANGGWFDESAVPAHGAGPGQKAAIAAQKATRESLGAVRSAMLDFYDRQVRDTGRGRWPTIAELRGTSVLPAGLPENPFNGSNKVVTATSRQAQSRDIVGSGEGWAYYDGTGGGRAVFYANTRMSGQNIW